MEKTMQQLSVSTKSGEIWIEQGGMGEDSMGVSIHPEQLPLLIDWLQEAAAELKKE